MQMDDAVKPLYISVREIGVLDEGFLYILLVADFLVGCIDQDYFGDRGELVEQFFDEDSTKDSLLS